ncbi:MAG: Spy/CpxP family protein refolding chaperone [Desulfatiglandaceae bacterium]|jgi:Spy/CpxP family protein refolding chaperone
MKLNKFLTLTLMVVVLFAGAVPAIAGGFGGVGQRHWERPGFAGLKTFLKLDLTDAQRSQLLNIMDSYQAGRRNVAHNPFEARRNLFKAMHSEKFDEANLRKAFEQLSSIKEDAFVLRARMRSEMKAVLTPEQLSLLQKRHRGHFERAKHRVEAPPEPAAE